MRAARQGTFDGLCGIYAVLNALDPAGYKRPRGSVHARLFKELTYALGSVSLLSAMHDGLDRDDLLRAATSAFRWLALEHDVVLSIEAPYAKHKFKTPRVFMDILRGHLEGRRDGVIAYIVMPGRDHWTVPTEIVGQQLILRDSTGLTSLPVKRLATASRIPRLSPQDTLIIRRRDD